MADAYLELLEAAIQHLRELKRSGVHHVTISAGTLAKLEAPVSRSIAWKPQAGTPGIANTAAATPKTPLPTQTAGAAPKGVLPVAEPRTPPPPTQSIAQAPGSLRLQPTPAALQVSPASASPKQLALDQLRDRVRACAKCGGLAAARNSVVFGTGNPEAELMFVGEAPGSDEDKAGEPFVGQAGQLLTKMITAMGLTRELVYIANILKCRPDTPAQTSGNRPPTIDEMTTCIEYLHAQVEIIRPKVIVALGGVALNGLLGKTGISQLRGSWLEYRGIPLMPTFHPSYLLRPDGQDKKRLAWEDMLQVMERLAIPISARQRGYFLK